MTSQTPTPLLRLGLVHWTFPPTTGGVESHIFDLARFLANLGCSVTVITGEPSPVASEDWSTFSTPLLSINRVRDGKINSKSYDRELSDFFRSVVRAHNLELIHGHNLHHFHPGPALVLNELRQDLDIQIHHTFHETWPDLLHETPVYRNWDGNYAVSEFVQNQCKEFLGFSPRLLRLGIDLDRFAPGPPVLANGKAPVILHPARLLPWKGVHISVSMLRCLMDREVEARLIITDTQRIADWNHELENYRSEISTLISHLQLGNSVEFRSASYTDMPSIYHEADIVIYPTLGEEPFGLVPIEAMACERPVVGSRSGGITETILEGQTGFICEPGDVSSLASHVLNLISSPDLALRLGRKGRRRVRRLFNGARYAERLLTYYKRK